MEKVLEGVKVLEVSAWAFVPSAGAVLADWGADVVKIEPPSGDPIRGLINAGVGGGGGPTFTWEIFNRGKRSVAMDLTQPAARDIVLKLAAEADVFLTSYLPPVRRKLGLDVDDIQAVNPGIVYAAGSGQGARGPEAEKGGYDSISFWSRGGVCASATPPDYHRPVGMPAGAFGDSISGMALAGGIAAALVRKGRTGEGAVVNVALLNTAMWAMQMSIVGAAMAAAGGLGVGSPARMTPNPLVNTYRTSDDRWVALCMLQPDVYWEGLVRAIGRDDMVDDPRFAQRDDRLTNAADFIAELEKTFASATLAHWRGALATQPGQWDVVQTVTELPNDQQVVANGFCRPIDYGDGFVLPLVSSPAQFDGQPPDLKPAPGFSADADEVLHALGMDPDAILEAKLSNAVI